MTLVIYYISAQGIIVVFDDSTQSISHCFGSYLGEKQAGAVQSTCQNIEVLP